MGSRAVQVAILGNTVVFSAKAGAWVVTGSSAMLSEAIHSAADVMNQCLLAYGLSASAREADEDHPYGYGFDRYVWSMISAVGSFFLGAGASVYHGLHSLAHPGVLESTPIALGVLGLAGVLEGYTATVAWDEVSKEAKKRGMTPYQYIVDGPDPINVGVFLEDAIAVGGVGTAALCIGLAQMTGNAAFDAFGSIAVGGLMGESGFASVRKSAVGCVIVGCDFGRRAPCAVCVCWAVSLPCVCRGCVVLHHCKEPQSAGSECSSERVERGAAPSGGRDGALMPGR